MAEELITPENVTKELLKEVLDAAFMDTSYDNEGDLLVKEHVNCFLLLGDKKDRVFLLCVFGFKPGTSMLQRLECVNKINEDYAIVKAWAGSKDSLRFGYHILLSGGINRKAFVLAVKRFCSIPHDAIADYGQDIVR